MEEKFSVSLELMIQKFKDGAKKAQEVSQNVASKIKDNMSVDVGTNAFKGMNAESELLLNKINDIKATLQMASDNPKLLPKQDILEMRVELEKLENQYTKINQKSNMFSSSFNKIQGGMNKSLKSAKRFTLSLFGIQSIYRMLSRASSAYLAQDQETSNKIQSAWIGLGSVFAPLLSTIANFTIKAVSYINVFIKALTGTDFLANAMAKSMNKANKSAGKLSKTLAGFDELTNLDDDAGGGSIDTSWIDSFKNVELNPKITQFFENLGKVLNPIYETIKNIIKGFDDLDTTSQVLMATLGISGLVGILTGNVGLAAALAIIIPFVYTLVSAKKEATKETDNLKNASERLKKSEEDLITAKEKLTRATDTYVYAVDKAEESQKKLEDIEKKLGISGSELQRQVDNGTLSYQAMTDRQKEVYKAYLDNEGAQDNLKKSTEELKKETENKRIADEKHAEAIKKKIDQLEIENSKIDKTSEAYRNNQTEIDDLKESLKDLTGQDYSTSVEVIAKANMKEAQKDYDNWASKIGRNMGKFFEGLVSLDFSTMKKALSGGYAKGLDYVPYEGMYHLHPGEKVVPAKFNSDDYVSKFNSGNNAETNSLLRVLIDTLEDKDMNAYISEREIGTASQRYKNKQSRIMGEELI